MTSWLDPVRASLAVRCSPLAIFIRNDDAGWHDDRLFRLLEIVNWHEAPMDIAAIPTAVSAPLGRELRHQLDRSDGRIAVHQHGFAHTNHELAGRKSEFGPARSRPQQREDIILGRRRLQDALGRPLPGIFTPPWNRCTDTTARCLAKLGFEMLSCDSTATPFAIEELAEQPVHLDWSGKHGVTNGPTAWGELIAASLRTATARVGLLLHHAVMNDEDRRMFAELLTVLHRDDMVRLRPMSDARAAPSEVMPS
jgi:peptidoglycan/xylan/chitin deacetylase (PgdA/CDA1 family)